MEYVNITKVNETLVGCSPVKDATGLRHEVSLRPLCEPRLTIGKTLHHRVLLQKKRYNA
jgi:hypothetical protein